MARRIFKDIFKQPDITEDVRCYLCLHRLKDTFGFVEKAWSLKGTKSGRVLAHAKAILLHDCTFEVQQAGRERTVKENKKYVHAFVRGTVKLDHKITIRNEDEVEIFYNPKTMNCFQDIDGRKIIGAKFVVFEDHLMEGRKSRVTAVDPVFEVEKFPTIW